MKRQTDAEQKTTDVNRKRVRPNPIYIMGEEKEVVENNIRVYLEN